MKTKTIILLLLGCTFFGVGLVSVLFLMSEEKMQRNNAFQRRYVPQPIEKIGNYSLGYPTYYIAGITEDSIYLGNQLTPLFLTSIDLSLQYSNTYQLGIDSIHLPYRRMTLTVKPPYYFAGDGTVPVLFRGVLAERTASLYTYDDAYFSNYTVADTTRIGIVTMSSETDTTVLGLLTGSSDSISVSLNTQILLKQQFGYFDSEGRLLWNAKYRQFIYPYLYRNAYEVTDDELNYISAGTTIDTISQAILDVVYYESTDQYKKGSKSVPVNLYSTTYDDYLYIHTDRLGRYEDSDALRTASIIDVYNLNERTYAFSFYFYHQHGKKLRQFEVYKDYIVGLVDDQLWLYRLKSHHFAKNQL